MRNKSEVSNHGSNNASQTLHKAEHHTLESNTVSRTRVKLDFVEGRGVVNRAFENTSKTLRQLLIMQQTSTPGIIVAYYTAVCCVIAMVNPPRISMFPSLILKRTSPTLKDNVFRPNFYFRLLIVLFSFVCGSLSTINNPLMPIWDAVAN